MLISRQRSHDGCARCLRARLCHLRTGVTPFDPEHPGRFPNVEALLGLARAWLRTADAERMGFYTAPEEEQVEEVPRNPPQAQRRLPQDEETYHGTAGFLPSRSHAQTGQPTWLSDRTPAGSRRAGSGQSGSGSLGQPGHSHAAPAQQARPPAPDTASAFAACFGPPPKARQLSFWTLLLRCPRMRARC